MGLVLAGWAAADGFGRYSPLAFFLMVFAALAAFMAVRANRAETAPSWAWVVGLTTLAGENLMFRDGFPAVPLGAVAIALSLAVMVATLPVRSRVRTAALALTGVALAVFITLPWRWGQASIDVFDAVTHATGAVLHGHNPYSSQFSLLAWTWPGVGPGHVYSKTVPFLYGPLVSILAIPGYLLGDVRFSNALATAALVSAVWVAGRRSASSLVRIGAPLAVAVMPFTFGMILEAWVDVFMMAGFAGWCVLRRDHPRLAILCLATCLLVKPTVGIALLPPFIWLRSARREGLAAVGLAAAVLVPLAIATGPARLWRDVIGIQMSLPPRGDGLTVISHLYWQFGITIPTVIGTAVTGLAAVALLRNRPSDMTDLLTRAAALSFTAFLCAKWAFFNYYYVSAVLLVLALASQGWEFDPKDVALPLPRRLHGLGVGRARRPVRRGAAG